MSSPAEVDQVHEEPVCSCGSSSCRGCEVDWEWVDRADAFVEAQIDRYWAEREVDETDLEIDRKAVAALREHPDADRVPFTVMIGGELLSLWVGRVPGEPDEYTIDEASEVTCKHPYEATLTTERGQER